MLTQSANWEPYPEQILELPEGQLQVEVSTPQHLHVVMGASGKAAQEVFEEELRPRNVTLHKRKGGGGTVLLGPGTIVVTVHAGVAHTFRNLAYFKSINLSLIEVFRSWKDLPYACRGISDIAVDDRKIVGSSIFRRRQYLLFQASILFETDYELMNQLLRHPPREPDYRAGRSHRQFITSLRELGIAQTREDLAQSLRDQLPELLNVELRKVDRQPEQSI